MPFYPTHSIKWLSSPESWPLLAFLLVLSFVKRWRQIFSFRSTSLPSLFFCPFPAGQVLGQSPYFFTIFTTVSPVVDTVIAPFWISTLHLRVWKRSFFFLFSNLLSGWHAQNNKPTFNAKLFLFLKVKLDRCSKCFSQRSIFSFQSSLQLRLCRDIW